MTNDLLNWLEKLADRGPVVMLAGRDLTMSQRLARQDPANERILRSWLGELLPPVNVVSLNPSIRQYKGRPIRTPGERHTHDLMRSRQKKARNKLRSLSGGEPDARIFAGGKRKQK